jgi:hypothetical protein
MKALVGLLATCLVLFAFARSAPAQVVFSFGPPLYYPWYGGYYGYPGYAYYGYPGYYGYGWGGYYRPWWRHRYYGGYYAGWYRHGWGGGRGWHGGGWHGHH